MVNRIYSNPNIINTSPATKSGTLAATGSFASVYNRMQELRTAAANRTASPFAAQAAEAAPSYSSVYAPGNRGVYALRPVDLEDPAATLQKLQELEKDIIEKGEAGFFDGMDDNEDFAYLFEKYADTFGDDFMDYGWRCLAMHRPLSEHESDQARSRVYHSFEKYLMYALHDSLGSGKGAQWNGRNISYEEGTLIRQKRTEAFSAYFGYGEMTPEERYQAILSDYRSSGDVSYAATQKMLWLLDRTDAVDFDTYLAASRTVHDKQRIEYASLDMTVADMAKSRYANAYYGFDADAEILSIVDFMHETRKNILATSPHLTDLGAYSDPNLFQFFEKLTADLQTLGGAMDGIF